MTLILYFVIFIFRSPLGGPHVITHDVTNIPSDLMMSPTSPKIDMTSYPHIHGPLWEARTPVLAYGILTFEALHIFPFEVLQPLLISLSCYNRISVGDIVSKTMTTSVNTVTNVLRGSPDMPRGRTRKSSPADRLTINAITRWPEPWLAEDGGEAELKSEQSLKDERGRWREVQTKRTKAQTR